MDRFANRKVALAAAAAAAAAVSATAAAAVFMLSVGGNGALFDPNNASLVARGEAVYVENCASCHGRNLEGQPDWRGQDAEGFLPAPPHDESGHTWHHPDQLLFDITKRGVAEAANLDDYKTRMPAFGELLDDADIIAVLSYIKSQWLEDMRRRHDKLNRVYERRETPSK